MSQMFAFAIVFDSPLNSWNTIKVTTTSNMFLQNGAFNQPIGNWNTSALTNMSAMFSGAYSFNQDISNWDVSKVTNMAQAFSQASAFNQDLSNWNIAAATNLIQLFYQANNFDQSLAAWAPKFNASANLTSMLGYSGLSIANYDATLIAFNTAAPNGRVLGAEGLKYCSAKLDRANLVGTKGWTISGDIYSGIEVIFSVEACGSYQWIDGITYTANTSTPTFLLTNQAGCDSLIKLNLTINSPSSGIANHTACNSFTWIDGITYSTSNTTATYILPSAKGCDSIVTLNLQIIPVSVGVDSKSACSSYTWVNGVTYTASTSTPTYTVVNGSVNGCDSIVTLNLTINQPYSIIHNKSACEQYTWIDGNTYFSSTNLPTFILPSVNGCDSLITLNLTINNGVSTTDTKVACGSYQWIDGITYTASNTTATHLLTTLAGCDSLVLLKLTINQPTSGIATHSACNSFTWIDGVTYSSSTNAPTFILPNAGGCDSVVTLNFTINSVNTSVTQNGTTLTSSATGATYRWIDCTNGNAVLSGQTAASFTSLVNGNYAVEVTQNTCVDTSSCFAVIINGLTKVNADILSIYPNPTSGTITLHLATVDESNVIVVRNALGQEVAQYFIGSNKTYEVQLEGSRGVYFIELLNADGVVNRTKVVKQ